MMTIMINLEELRDFQNLIKTAGIRHGPFSKEKNRYRIPILDTGPIETFLRLKYMDRIVD